MQWATPNLHSLFPFLCLAQREEAKTRKCREPENQPHLSLPHLSLPPHLTPLQVMEGGAAYNDGRISVGDRLVAVKNLPTGDFYLDNCTHEESVQVG